MSETDNETPTVATPLRVGLIADSDEVARYADALRNCPAFELAACGGVPQSAAPPDVPWFDDTRVLVAQGGVQALVVASSPRVGVHVGEVAASHAVHVWRPPPLGRNFAEAVEVARQRDGANVVYRVSSWWDHVRDHIRPALEHEPGCDPGFSEVRVSAAGPPLQSWRSSLAHAGGGVLACDAYAHLEALIAIRGLPESVIGITGKCRRRRDEAPRETEDVATVMLRYEGDGLALIRALWDAPPYESVAYHFGRETGVRYDMAAVTVLSRDGAVVAEAPVPGNLLPLELSRFAAEIGGGQQPKASGRSLNRHLAVSAVLEAAYLSARTGHPENPRRLFEVQKWPSPAR